MMENFHTTAGTVHKLLMAALVLAATAGALIAPASSAPHATADEIVGATMVSTADETPASGFQAGELIPNRIGENQLDVIRNVFPTTDLPRMLRAVDLRQFRVQDVALPGLPRDRDPASMFLVGVSYTIEYTEYDDKGSSKGNINY